VVRLPPGALVDACGAAQLPASARQRRRRYARDRSYRPAGLAGDVVHGPAGPRARLFWAWAGDGLRGESPRLGGQGGRESGEEDVEAAFEFGGAVVAGEGGGEAAD